MPRRAIDAAWVAFAVLNVAAMVRFEAWETIPFHFIWVSLTLLYGFRVWGIRPTVLVLAAVAVVTGALIGYDIHHGTQEWGELTEVPLMAAMFLAMVWHARRRQQAMWELRSVADTRASMLERQERFLHDASHELRTPVTIARGHLELQKNERGASAEVEVALDELDRIAKIIDRLLLLARAEQPRFVVADEIDLQPFLEDLFMRWSSVAPRGWRLGTVRDGTLRADAEALRIALDALLENAVQYTEQGDVIEVRAQSQGGMLTIEVVDSGAGIPADALDQIFNRFARGDGARSRAQGGAGLGLAIVQAIANAHGGQCDVRSDARGTAFALQLPGWCASSRPEAAAGVWERIPSAL